MEMELQRHSFMRRLVTIIRKLVIFLLLLIIAILTVAYVMMLQREQESIETAKPPFGQHIQTSDARIFVQDTGSSGSPAIILIHGTGAWSEIWRATIDALKNSGFRVVALDLPPFGFSEKLTGAAAYKSEKQAQRIAEVLRDLNIEKAIMVCHSVGCRSVVEMALRYPETVEKLVMADPALGFNAHSEEPVFEQNNPSVLTKTLLAPYLLRDAIIATYGSSPPSIKPIFSSFVYDASCVTDERVKMLQKPLVINGMTRAEGEWLENLSVAYDDSFYNDFQNLKRLTMPTLLLWGREDLITPLWQGEKLQQLIPNSKLVIIDNTGHIPYIENKDKFNEYLLEFLQNH
jgi:pimeloyl-ACP methyl ester carboxylesterase